MELTWKDGVTTISTGGAVILERAHFHNWDLPRVASTRWAVFGLLILWGVNLALAYMIGRYWAAVEYTLAILGAGAGIYGLVSGSADALVLLMVVVVAMWAVEIADHLIKHKETHIHAK
jgi:hypothetical protein